MPFQKLFRSTPKASDGLTQAAREAIVDVLHYCMYADRHIASREDEFIEAAARTLNWDPNVSYEYYEGKSTGAVRAALANPDSKVVLFDSIKQRLPGSNERAVVLELAADLVLSDGRKDHSEALVIGELKQLLAT